MATVSVSDQDFATEVLGAEQPVLVDFWAEWCGPCKALGPKLEELSEEFSGVKVVKVNIDDNPETPAKYGVKGIPTMILFKGGESIDQVVGNKPLEDLRNFLQNNS